MVPIPTFAQMTDRITIIEFTTVRPTIANQMLCARAFLANFLSINGVA